MLFDAGSFSEAIGFVVSRCKFYHDIIVEDVYFASGKNGKIDVLADGWDCHGEWLSCQCIGYVTEF